MGIEAVKFRTDGFYSQPFAFGDEQIRQKHPLLRQSAELSHRYRQRSNLGRYHTGLPDDWRCPRCKQGKEKFNKV